MGDHYCCLSVCLSVCLCWGKMRLPASFFKRLSLLLLLLLCLLYQVLVLAGVESSVIAVLL